MNLLKCFWNSIKYCVFLSFALLYGMPLYECAANVFIVWGMNMWLLLRIALLPSSMSPAAGVQNVLI